MNRRTSVSLAVVLTLLTLLVSSNPSYTQPSTPPELQKLQQDAGGQVEFTWSPQSSHPTFIRGHIPLSPTTLKDKADPVIATLAFVGHYAEVFGVRDTATELEVARTEVDELGMIHVTLRQVYQGVEVYNGQIKVHVNADGKEVVAVSNGFVPGIGLDSVKPQLSVDQAEAVARGFLPQGSLVHPPELVVYPGAGSKVSGTSAKLAWLVELQDDAAPARNVYVVDAADGVVLDALNRLYEQGGGLATPPSAEPAFASPAVPSAPQCDPEVYYGIWHCTDDGGNTHLIVVDLNDSHVRVQTVLSSGPNGECNSVNHSGKDPSSNCPPPYPTETMASMLGRYVASGAVAIINTDYGAYPPGDHGAEGLAVRIGQRLDGVGHGDTDGNATRRSSLAFSATKAARIGKPASESQIDPSGAYYNTVAGGPVIVNEGQVLGNDACSNDGLSSGVCTRVAQSAAGLTGDGRLILITAQKDAAGIASYLTANYHVHSALKFDGGGSARVAWMDSTGQIQTHGATSEDRAVTEGLLVFSTRITDPDDNRVITSGQTLWGTIEPANDVDTYYFDASQGERVTIQMTKSNFTPSLDPYLILYAPDGSEVTHDDDSGEGNNALIDRVPLSQTDRYRIEAKSYQNSSTGLYSLRLTLQQPGRSNRETYDANHSTYLPGTLVRSEGQGPTGDQDVDNAHDFAGDTYYYYRNTHGRDSYDDQGAAIVSTVHYGRNYNNAFWNGEQMVYGDGFATKDVVAHELTHAVTEHSANLEYRWQSGALNESFSDIFAAMVDREDWLIGEDLPPDALGGQAAIRDMSNPPRFGQPDHTRDWVSTCDDNEGVHTNSGIPNKAYYNIATNSAVGKDKAERIFFRTLVVYLQSDSSLEIAREAALQSAQDLYGGSSVEYNAVRDGFNAVGLDGNWNPPANDCTCAAVNTLSPEPDGLRLLGNLRSVRDTVFAKEPLGQRWVQIYYKHQFEVAWLLLSDSQLRADAQTGFRAFDPVFRALMAGNRAESRVILTPDMIGKAEKALMGVARRGSPALHDDIVREWERVKPYRFAGWEVQKVRQQLRSEYSGR